MSKQITLAEIADIDVGYAFKSVDFTDSPQDLRLIRGDNIGQGLLRWIHEKRWPIDRVDEVVDMLMEAGDVVLAMDRPWISGGLKYAVIRESDLPALLVQRVARVRATSGIDQGFVRWLIASQDFTDYVLAVQTGTTIPHLSGNQIKRFPVHSLPSLAEQQAISDVLGGIDDKIESNRRIVKQIELVLLAHSNSLSTLPRVALHEVSKSYRRPVNPLVLGDEWVDHFSLPAFDVAAMPERCQASSIMSGKFGIETTSVLISRLNPDTPRVWCAGVREVPAMCSSEFLVLEPLKKSSVGALWLAAVHPSLREQMVQRATGTSFSHQRIKSDDALSVEVPDIRMIDEQTRGECDELIAMVGKRRGETEYLSRLRDVLLPELLSGRLRVKDAESFMECV